MLGNEMDDFIYALPDIRMPPNQLWPMHWHDCWTLVIVLEGGCLLGDWYISRATSISPSHRSNTGRC